MTYLQEFMGTNNPTLNAGITTTGGPMVFQAGVGAQVGLFGSKKRRAKREAAAEATLATEGVDYFGRSTYPAYRLPGYSTGNVGNVNPWAYRGPEEPRIFGRSTYRRTSGVGAVKAMSPSLFRSTKARYRRALSVAQSFDETYDANLLPVYRLYAGRERRGTETSWGRGWYEAGAGAAPVGVQIVTSRDDLEGKIALLTALGRSARISVLAADIESNAAWGGPLDSGAVRFTLF